MSHYEEHEDRIEICPTKKTILDQKRPKYKYDEDLYLDEITAYINKTYGEHYSQDKFQATEFIIANGLGQGFCLGNVLKYTQRYGKKGLPNDWRKDLLKVIHYAIISLHVHDLEINKPSVEKTPEQTSKL